MFTRPLARVLQPSDLDAYGRAQSLGYSSARVVVAGGEHWSGHRPDKIDALS